MPDLGCSACRFQEAVAAVARIFHEPIALGDRPHPVPEQPTQVSHFLRKPGLPREAIGLTRKDERMAASHTRVLVDAAIGDPSVGVMAQKARQRVPDVGQRSVLAEILFTAPASTRGDRRPAKDFVVDGMPPQRASETIESHVF
jgi:hypothetical protein